MANVAHSTLTGSNLHENKGVASASDNTVATASSGATLWQKLTADHLTGTGNPFGGNMFAVRYTTSNGNAGSSYSSGAWRVVNLNSTTTSEIAGASRSSNDITLPAGTYHVLGTFLGNVINSGGSCQIRLRNTSAGSTLLTGMGTGAAGTNAPGLANVNIHGRFTLASESTVQLQIFPLAANVTQSDYAGDGEPNVFVDLMFWRIA